MTLLKKYHPEGFMKQKYQYKELKRLVSVLFVHTHMHILSC